jgi:predicted GTPase
MKKVIKLTERDLINIIRRVIKEQEVDEDRLDYKSMSDEELHDFHPEIKKHPRHFKNFEPRGEFLRWRGEVAKRNIYKKGEKFHNAFDKETED